MFRASVVTMTPSPAVDRVYLVDSMVSGEVNRARRVQTFLSGKGINVARNLRNAGGRALAVTTLNDQERELIGGDGLYRIVSTDQATRVNTVVISGDGATTNVNEHPPPMSAEAWRALCATADAAVREKDADWLVVAGSIPARTGEPSGPLDPHPLKTVQASGTRLCVDSSGPGLRAWITAGLAPDLIKPNAAELAAATGRPVATVGDALDAAHRLIDRGTSTVLASLGADGALLVTNDQEIWAKPPRVDVVNTTGAGDAALAGFLADHVGDPDEAALISSLRRAVAWGALAVREFETVPVAHPPVAGIVVDTPPRGMRLA
ncbi:1-phosphofructokinase family hexose kinase [Microbacterium halophytorum]|uniref:1-phosphofructokinase family hexose kinase n=1 Tax=Microbacterium halophytorum TaxID=2067568 RepID=UPI001319F96B|nr:1-phosphofructokinase family hexose kinase [Microbacterium halophytorum]